MLIFSSKYRGYGIFIITLTVIFGLSACDIRGNSEKDPEPPPVITKDGNTFLKIQNNTGYAVNVYIETPPLYGNTSNALWRIDKNASAQRELQPTPEWENGTTLYFEYLIPVGNVVIPYYPNSTEYVKIKRLTEDQVNIQEVPNLGNTKTDSIFILIQNNSRDTIWFQQGPMTWNPYGSTLRDIPAGNDGVIVFGGNISSLNNCTIGDLTRRNFPDTTLEKGKIYTFIYDGTGSPGLFLVEYFDPDMAKNVWSIPTGTELNRSLTVGFFAPRANPNDGYLVLGNINTDNKFASNSYYKTAPYFSTIDQKGNIDVERIIPFPSPNPNQSLFRYFLEDTSEYVFFGQRRHEGESKPFIMGISPGGFVINYYYTGFINSIDETRQTLDSYGLVKVQNRQYGIACNAYDTTAGRSIFIANVTTTWNSASHSDLWRSPTELDVAIVDMIFDQDYNVYIVLAEDYEYTEFVRRTIIYFVDAQQPQNEKFSPIIGGSNIVFKKIVKTGADYYVLGYYDNPVGRGEGLLQKLDPSTGNMAWNTPERFTPKDTMNHLAVSNFIADNGKLILAGYTNAVDVFGTNGNPWICAFDPIERKKIWESEYTEYIDYTVSSIHANGIGSYILELYNKYNRDSLLVSIDLMGRPAAQNFESLPRRTDLNYAAQETANLNQFSVEIVPMTDLEITPPVLQIPRGQSGTFTVTGAYANYEWYLDGDLAASGSGTYTLQTNSLTRGVHTVTAIVMTSADERRSGSYTVRITN